MISPNKKNEAKLKSNLTDLFGGPDQFEIYEGLKSHQERVKFVFEQPIVRNLFKTQVQALKLSDACLKNDRESKRLRELGNAAFKAARDQKALELYSEALTYADRNNGKDNTAFALALANRSAVHVRMGGRWVKYAILDIDRAIKAGHPSPLKLLERKVVCFEELKEYENVSCISYLK